MQLRTQKFASLAGFALALCLFSGNARADDACSKDEVEPLSTPHVATYKQRICHGERSCETELDKHAKLAKEFSDAYAIQCQGLNGKMEFDTTDSQLVEKYKATMNKTASGYEQLSALAKKKAGEVTEKMKPLVAQAKSAMASPTALATATNINDDHRKTTNVESKVSGSGQVSETDLPTNPSLKNKLAPTQFGTLLRKKLLAVADYNEKMALKVRETLENSKVGKTDMASPPPETPPPAADKKSGGMLDSLMNPSTLLGMAGAGASLLAAMKKPSDVSASTPDAPTAPAPIAPLAATTLGAAKDGTAASQKVQMTNDAAKTDPTIAAPSFGGEGYHPIDSDVSNNSHSPSLNGGAQAATSGAPSVMGMGGSSGDTNTHREPGSAVIAAKAPEDSSGGSFSGGGGGGGLSFGNSSSGTSADAAPPAAEDPLRDTLHDAIAAGETPSDPGLQTSDPSLQSEDSEVLFTRVKSCIQRSIKRGLVISGLSAKIR